MLPLDCFKEFRLNSNSHFSDIQHLHIGFTRCLTDPTDDDGGEVDIPEIADTVGSFFGSMTCLRNLELSWGVERTQPDWDQISVCEVILQGVFYSAVWPTLQVLRIYRMKTEPDQLLSFLSRHTSVKWLSLHFSIRPDEQSSFKSMITRFRDELDLERFELIAHESQQGIYDSEWRPIKDSVLTDTKVRIYKYIELYSHTCEPGQ